MKFSFFIASICAVTLSQAQSHPIEKIWYNAEKTSKIKIFLATDGKYYGQIVWLKNPNDANGQARMDIENPDKAKRSRPMMNLLILHGFTVSAENKNLLEGGKVYDPTNGKTYCGKLTLRENTLDLRGYICGMSWLGRTSQWTVAD
jgi:uncharacterized protein (DUF2147 family)